jgi:ribonucleoside-diphosphate reductase alpha chain
MGFADLLLLRGERYGSPESERTASQVMACVAEAARRASLELGLARGAFPAFRGLGPPRRNASLLAVAPTGTLRLLAGCNGGIEPWLDPVLRVETAEGGAHRFCDAWLLDWLEARAADPGPWLDALEAGLPSDALAGLGPAERELLRRGHEVPAEAQLALQARFQAHVDGAVSKTVQLAPDVSDQEIVALIQRARTLGCKGVAFWRSTGSAPARCVRCAALPEPEAPGGRP